MPRTRQSYTVKRRVSAKLLTQVGQRLRWVREAFEAREPGQHTQEKWAAAFGISAASLSRWESGKMLPMLDVLYRHVYFTGTTFDYVFFGVLSAQIVPWLRDDLATKHPTELQDEAGFFLDRDRRIEIGLLRRAPTPKRRAAPRKS
jgi:transcriptional regulator with XRE-family HTH domain